MNKQEVQTYCTLIKDNDSLYNKEQKIEQNKLKLALSLVSKEEIKRAITEQLIEEGVVALANGESSYSKLQRRIVHFINVQLWDDLKKSNKTSFSITEEEQEEIREEKEGDCILNANGHLILVRANCSNINNKRLLAKTKENAEKLNKNK